jgi:hypothetical protein
LVPVVYKEAAPTALAAFVSDVLIRLPLHLPSFFSRHDGFNWLNTAPPMNHVTTAGVNPQYSQITRHQIIRFKYRIGRAFYASSGIFGCSSSKADVFIMLPLI